ncbi:unnamed protein product [Diatraea saccharalis]|uniref:Amidase domain-containing protein n=1 Tax=Diatraea saccharalis TaxID=40085 RepID=A0A9N9R3B7_9NEOP|nr:unnamed protein product [Diatraea saccharalis]
MCNVLSSIVRFIRSIYEVVFDFLFSLYWERKKEMIPDLEAKHAFLSESAVTLAKKIRNRELKSEELVQAVIERIKQVNPIINAVVDNRYEQALAEARAVDSLLATGVTDLEKTKPFLGVPFTTKESQPVKGLSVTYGLWLWKNKRAEEDCEAVARLRNAGAIPLAVTNLPELLIWSEARNPVHGATKNPHHTGRTAGGSSGAEAALMATYSTVIGLSSDIAGSTRIPSFYCGMFGYNPTADVVNLKGIFSRNGQEPSSMLCFGFISKHMEDQAPLMKVIAGDKAHLLRLDREVDIKDIKVFFTSSINDIWMSSPNAELKDVMNRVILKLGQILPSENKPLPYYHKCFDNIINVWKHWMSKEPEDYFNMYTDGKGKPNMLWEMVKKFLGFSKHSLYLVMRLCGDQLLPAVNAEWAETLTQSLKDDLFSKLGDNGVLLLPSSPLPCPYHYYTYINPYNFGAFAVSNVLKCPAVQVPIGVNSKNIPVGIQVLAAPHNDAVCLTVAKYLEKEFGGAVMACKVK